MRVAPTVTTPSCKIFLSRDPYIDPCPDVAPEMLAFWIEAAQRATDHGPIDNRIPAKALNFLWACRVWGLLPPLEKTEEEIGEENRLAIECER